MANGTFRMKIDIDRHGPRLMPKNCKNLNPPYFSLPSTFNICKTEVSYSVRNHDILKRSTVGDLAIQLPAKGTIYFQKEY